MTLGLRRLLVRMPSDGDENPLSKMERLAPAVVPALTSMPSIMTLLAADGLSVAYFSIFAAMFGGGITQGVANKVEAAARRGIGKFKGEFDAHKAETEWALLCHSAQIEQLSEALTPRQVDQIATLFEQLLRTSDVQREERLLKVVESTAARVGTDDTRTKLISEVVRLGETHFMALLDIATQTRFASRENKAAAVDAHGDRPPEIIVSRRFRVSEEFAKHMALDEWVQRVPEPVIDALAAAGLVRVDSFSPLDGASVRAVPKSLSRALAKPEIVYVAATSLGMEAIQLLFSGHRYG